MTASLRPETAAQVREMLREARSRRMPITIMGGGSKSEDAAQGMTCLETAGLSGIEDYDPGELVITVWAGTPFAEVEHALAKRGQMLAFEPCPTGALSGRADHRATIGGIVAANACGPRRFSAGAVRDHLLGFEAVSGAGEIFKAGGRVVKNVTGFDLSKLMAGSWGTLAVLTSVTLRTVPAPQSAATLVIDDLDGEQARVVMLHAARHPAGPSGIAHHGGRVLLRLEGFPPAVEARCESLAALFARQGLIRTLYGDESDAAWRRIATLADLPDSGTLWRISVPPAAGWAVIAALAPSSTGWLQDWGGALNWVLLDGDEGDQLDRVLTLAAGIGAIAYPVRCSATLRERFSAVAMRENVLAAVTRRIKAAFDPDGILNPRRVVMGGEA